MGDLDYFGVNPRCGCVTAWLSEDHATEADVRDFSQRMNDGGRVVHRGVLTDEMRRKLGPCDHSVTHNGCLALGAPVDPVPHPTFTGGQAWTCGRCLRTFSEAHPTFWSGGECGRARRGEPTRETTPERESGDA